MHFTAFIGLLAGILFISTSESLENGKNQKLYHEVWTTFHLFWSLKKK